PSFQRSSSRSRLSETQASAGVIWSVSIASSFFPGIFGSQKIRARPRTRWPSAPPDGAAAVAGLAGGGAPGLRRAGWIVFTRPSMIRILSPPTLTLPRKGGGNWTSGQRIEHRVGGGTGREAPAQVLRGPVLPGGGDDGLLDLVGARVVPQVTQHHGPGQDRADRIRDPFAGVLGRRPVHRFKEPTSGVRIDVGRRRLTERSEEHTSE